MTSLNLEALRDARHRPSECLFDAAQPCETAPAMRVAVVVPDIELRRAVANVVHRLGHFAHAYASAHDALAVQARGLAFDRLVFACTGTGTPARDQLREAYDIVGKAPTLFLHAPDQSDCLDGLYRWNAKNVGALLPLAGTQLDLLMHLLEVPYRERPLKKVEIFGSYLFAPYSHRAYIKDREVPLKHIEFSLALLLFRNASKVCTRDWLRVQLWLGGVEERLTWIDLHVSRIRKLLELNGSHDASIHKIEGASYRLDLHGEPTQPRYLFQAESPQPQ